MAKLETFVASQPPYFGKGKNIDYWAEGGFVRYYDQRDETPEEQRRGAITWQQAAHRCLALSEMLVKSSEDARWAHDRERTQQFIVDMEEVIRRAKEQHATLTNQASRPRRSFLRMVESF